MQNTNSRDSVLLFLARFLRLFSYGAISIVLLLYLAAIGLTEMQIGSLLGGIILGDLAITLYLTTHADRFGRRKTLAIGAMLKFMTGIIFSFTNNYYLLLLSGIIGVISTSGGQIGPFIAVEQACLTELKDNPSNGEIAKLFGWYNFFGYSAQALGALFSGLMVGYLQSRMNALQSYRLLMQLYAFLGLLKFIIYLCLSENVESSKVDRQGVVHGEYIFGIKRKQTFQKLKILCVLFALDAFAGGFVMMSFISFWFNKRWDFDINSLGLIIMIAQIISGISAVVASCLVNKIGAVLTMVVTHLPSNILLLLIPFMPSQLSAVGMFFARFCLSQMDVPARQAYVAKMVDSDERSAAGGITNVVRSVGLSISPWILGKLIANDKLSTSFNSPFVIAGVLKIVYDLLVFVCYRRQESESDPQKIRLPDSQSKL